jgi:hypothetical protein
MSISFRLLSTLAVLGSAFWACAPDLDALSSKYNPNAAGKGGSSGSGTGGSLPGTGGGKPETGGTSAVGGTGGGGTGGTEAGAAGQAGQGDTSGGTGGTGGSSTSGTGGSATSSCSNGSADSNETDVDCGGSSKCPRCDVRQHCGSNSDCLDTLFCKNGRCAQPSCSDNVQNGDETGVDCGGSCAIDGFTCEDGLGCTVSRDCTGEFCANQVCTDHCTSEKRESDETDVDCGGKRCSPCGDNKKCTVAGDCASKICTNKLCVPATCSDDVINQTESDTDCGGACTPLKYCAVDQTCNSAADCASYICTSGKCAADITIPAGDVVDDFEDGNNALPIPSLNGRAGGWYFFGDMTSTAAWSITPIDGQRGPSSKMGQHTSGSGFTTWGCGIGCDLNNGTKKQPYSATFDNGGTPTAYAGVTFWARASGALSLGVIFPDGDTDAAGGICNKTDATTCGEVDKCVCDHHYLTGVSLGTEWKRYTVLFKDLGLEPGTVPTPGPFDPTRLVSIQFRVNPSTTFDFWVDDVAFVRPQ